MLYKFKSRATSDLIMLEAQGRRVLQIIGKDAAGSGILTVAQIPAALEALTAAVAADDAARAAAGGAPSDDEATETRAGEGPSVSLRQRVAPFADMLRRSLEAGRDVVWGV